VAYVPLMQDGVDRRLLIGTKLNAHD